MHCLMNFKIFKLMLEVTKIISFVAEMYKKLGILLFIPNLFYPNIFLKY